VLDATKNSREGSPLFRAYLFERIAGIMELQPEAWGLAFAPAIPEHRRVIRQITGQLASGDWFVPAKVRDCREKLDQFFDSIKSVSYTRQAAGLFGLAHATASSGLRYVGFVSVDGKPVFTEGPPSAEIWGYGADKKQPALLANAGGPQTTFAVAPMPLSPLFSLGASRRELFAKAGINPSDSLFASALPPLFAAKLSAKVQP
jgi:hypothetical protein